MTRLMPHHPSPVRASRQGAVSYHDPPPEAPPSKQAGFMSHVTFSSSAQTGQAGRQDFCLIPCALALGPHQASRQGAACFFAVMAVRGTQLCLASTLS